MGLLRFTDYAMYSGESPPPDKRRPSKRGKRRPGGGGAATDADKRWDIRVPFGGSMVQVGSRGDAKRIGRSNSQPSFRKTYMGS